MDNNFDLHDSDLYALKYSMNIISYLDSLSKYKDKYIIIFLSKVNFEISNEIINRLNFIGLYNFTNKIDDIFIGIARESKIICNNLLKNSDGLLYENQIDKLTLRLTLSGSYMHVYINNEEYSLPADNMNFVIFDNYENKIFDISTFEPKNNNTVIHHRSIEFTEGYFDKNFFVIDEYKEKWRALFRNKYFSNRKLGYTTVVNGIIEPLKTINGKSCGGVADDKFNFIAGHDNFSGNGSQNARYVSESYRVPYDELEQIDETVIFGGIMYDHPGHLIIESIADRMWYVLQEADQSIKIAVLPCWNGREGQFLKQFIEALNISEDRVIYVRKPTQFRNVIVPESSERVYVWPNSCEFTKEYLNVFKHMKNQATPAAYEKIFLTKKKTNLGNIVGEDFFIEFYKKKGFQIINPEDYTIKEKVSLMLGAKEIVTPDGTNVLFTVFCNPSVKLTILSRVNNDMNTADFMVLDAAEIKNIKIVDVATSFFHKHFVFGLSLMSVTNKFIDYVREVYHEDVTLTPKESLKNNLYEYISYIPDYYSNPFIFNLLKNQKMLTIIQNISEVFLGKQFDTSKLDISTNESNLQNQVKDLIEQKSDLNLQIAKLSDENKILRTSIDNLNKDLYKAKEEKIEIISLQEKITKLLKSVQAEMKKFNEASERFDSERLSMKVESDKLHEELGRLSSENEIKTKRLEQLSGEKEVLNSALLETDAKLSKERYALFAANRKEDSLSADISLLKEEITKLEKEKSLAASELDKTRQELKNEREAFTASTQRAELLNNKIIEMQSTRSWRWTRIFRKNKKDEEI